MKKNDKKVIILDGVYHDGGGGGGRLQLFLNLVYLILFKITIKMFVLPRLRVIKNRLPDRLFVRNETIFRFRGIKAKKATNGKGYACSEF